MEGRDEESGEGGVRERVVGSHFKEIGNFGLSRGKLTVKVYLQIK